jgi:MFS family permease
MFYGWKIVMVTFVTNFISVGFLFYSYGVFFKDLSEEFGGGRFGVSLGLMVVNVVNAIIAPYLGRIVDRRSIRNIMSLGILSLGLGFILASRVGSILQFYVVLGGLIGVGAAMMGGLASSTLVANWFVRRRGMALAIATMGISFSGMVMAPVTTQMVSAYGWRRTFVVYGILTIVIALPLVRRFIVNCPEDIDLVPDGVSNESVINAKELGKPGLPLAPGDQMIDHPGDFEWSSLGMLRDRNFWSIALSVTFCFCSIGAFLTHLIPHATDLGYSPSLAAFALSVSAGAGVIGKLLFGWIADHIDTRYALWLSILLQTCGMITIQFASSYPALLATCGVFGLGFGGVVPLSGSLVGEVFGRRFFGRTFGLMGPCMLPLQFLGVPLAGYIFDRTQSYTLAFRFYVVLYILAACIVLFICLPGGKTGAQEQTKGGEEQKGPNGDHARMDVSALSG